MARTKPSVTEVMSEIYPFDNKFFIKSLGREGMEKKAAKGDLVPGGIAERNGSLDYDRTMDMLSMFGTVIHQAAFDLGTLGFAAKMEGTVYEEHLKSLFDFFDAHEVRAVAGEAFIDTPEYCGISDGVYSMLVNGVRQNVLLDWKTYGAYKYLYGIRQEILKKDGTANWRKDDFKKLSLQLGMYGRGFSMTERLRDIRIDSYAVVWVTQLGTFMCDVVPDITPFEQWLKNKSRTNLSL